MHDEPTPAAQEERADTDVLSLLLYDDMPHPWSDEEIARELGNPVEATDALSRLHRCGLVHRIGGFVFPTRAARRAAQLAS
jgi:hypothetical protein